MSMEVVNHTGNANSAAPQAGSSGIQLGNCSSLYQMTGVLKWGIENVTMSIDMAAPTSAGQTYQGMNVRSFVQ